MQPIISLFYLCFLFGTALMALFVVYHIARYSLSKESAFWGNILFLGVFVFFLATNVALFSRIDWNDSFAGPGGSPFNTSVW